MRCTWSTRFGDLGKKLGRGINQTELGLCLPSPCLPSSQNGDETGTWPNNQFDTEMLQAMILASASGKWRPLHGGIGDAGLRCLPQPLYPETGCQRAQSLWILQLLKEDP